VIGECSIWLERAGAFSAFLGSLLLLAAWMTTKRLKKLENQLKTFLSIREFVRTVRKIEDLMGEKTPLTLTWGVLSILFFVALVVAEIKFAQYTAELYSGSLPEVGDLVLPTFKWYHILKLVVLGLIFTITLPPALAYFLIWILCFVAYLIVFVLLFLLGSASAYVTKKLELKSPILVLGAFFLIIGALLHLVGTFLN
jgi:hypothetical protein